MGDLTIEIVHLPIEIVGASIKLKVLTNKNGVFLRFVLDSVNLSKEKLGKTPHISSRYAELVPKKYLL